RALTPRREPRVSSTPDLGFCPVFPRQSHGDIRAHQQYRGALGSNARPHFESTSLPQRTPFIRIPVALVAHAGTWLTRALDSMLAPQGYRVLSVTSGLELLAHAADMRPDVGLMEEALPDRVSIDWLRSTRPDVA